jgi:para-nitrobenzyl esterase
MRITGSREQTMKLKCVRVRIGSATVVLWLAALAILPATPAAAAILQATVTGGTVAGTVDPEHEIASFKGIPFAAPPVGGLRWKAPQPVVAWKGIKKADAFADSCPQEQEKSIRGSEDCLYLNIWTGARTRHETRPVMVWIYGGGFNGGASSLPAYDGTHFAREGVVFVSIAYRVGVLGFLAHPELSRESGNGSGAYGLQDQIAALQWVTANIREFGGDPDRVTIFGQSAGGISVSVLTAAPSARGLFRYAISESGGAFLQPPRLVEYEGPPLQSLEYAQSMGQRFLQSLNVTDLAQARQISTQKLLEAATQSPWNWWVVVDGNVLPGPNFDLYQHGRFIDTPILIGFNSDDRHGDPAPRDNVRWFEDYVAHNYTQCPSLDRSILAAYPHRTDTQAAQAYRDLFVDTWYGGNTWTWARLHSRYGRSSTYIYYFDIRTPETPYGADHGAEVPDRMRTVAQYYDCVRSKM